MARSQKLDFFITCQILPKLSFHNKLCALYLCDEEINFARICSVNLRVSDVDKTSWFLLVISIRERVDVLHVVRDRNSFCHVKRYVPYKLRCGRGSVVLTCTESCHVPLSYPLLIARINKPDRILSSKLAQTTKARSTRYTLSYSTVQYIQLTTVNICPNSFYFWYF